MFTLSFPFERWGLFTLCFPFEPWRCLPSVFRLRVGAVYHLFEPWGCLPYVFRLNVGAVYLLFSVWAGCCSSGASSGFAPTLRSLRTKLELLLMFGLAGFREANRISFVRYILVHGNTSSR